MSGEAEADFEKGYRVNLDGTRALFEAIRLEGPEGALQAEARLHLVDRRVRRAAARQSSATRITITPLTSYGTQKAIGELLLADYSRRGFFDGIGIRLPTIVDPAGQAEQGGVGLLLQHPARAAGRAGGRAAGRGKRAALVRQPARGGRASCCMRPSSTRRRSAAGAR